MTKKLSRLTAAITAVACGLVMMLGIYLSAASSTPKPTIYIEGMRLQNVSDGKGGSTIQALVDVYASGVEKLSAVALLMKFNNNYWRPSKYADNTTNAFPSVGGTVDYSSIFSANPSIYGGTENPFLFESSRTRVDPTAGMVMLSFNVRNDLPDLPGDQIEEVESSGREGSSIKFLYVNATNKVLLGTLSFQINPSQLENMTAEIGAGMSGQLNKVTAAGYSNNILYPTDAKSLGIAAIQWDVPHWTLSYVAGTMDPTTGKGDPDDDFRNIQYDNPSQGTASSEFKFDYKVPPTVIRVEAAEQEVIVNAYQAFTDGTMADIASTLQRYSSAVRLTYPNGDQRDEAMFWGKDKMTIKDNNSGAVYEFQYNPGGGYTVSQISGPTTPYNPKEGDYTVQQPYTYVEDGKKKTYPAPINVHLVVTPVQVLGVTAEKLQKTYRIDDPDLPQDIPELELPQEGRLVLDTMIGGAIPTVPLTTWTNTNGTGPVNTIPGALMGDLLGLDGSTSVTWPMLPISGNVGCGKYTFQSTDPTQANIEALFPWATVNASYTIDASRTIRPDTDTIIEYEAEAFVNDYYGFQMISVRRADGSPILSGTTFDVYRPDGVKVDPSWFNGTGTGGSRNVTANGPGYDITTAPGTDTAYNPADPPAIQLQKQERELTRRHINLGGYFTVVVHEPFQPDSDPIVVYQRRRQNIYLYNYDVPTVTGPSADNYPEFDFTGHKAGLYAFHPYSTLPSTVVLPLNCGYSVHTRYDGVTGAEPGEVRSFAVDAWNTVLADSGVTAPSWAANDVVTYGPEKFSDHSYGSPFGVVENPVITEVLPNKPKRQVVMKVEADDEAAPDPARQEKLTLTYEGAPAPANILNDSNGEVQKVTFDSKSTGYPYKQEFELTITNTGNVDVHGIYIDAIKDPSGRNEIQHFEITKPPASDLAPGASTTFTITYVLGLPAGIHEDLIEVGTSTGSAPIKDFYARFRVVDGKLYRLDIEPRPEDSSMGTGAAVVGVTGGTYDPTLMGKYLAQGDPIWVKVQPVDEYDIKEEDDGNNNMVPVVYYIDQDTKAKVYLTEYTGTLTPPLQPGERLFYIKKPDGSPMGMPAHDMTIYVEFYEPIPSKLRLSDLEAYAAELEDECLFSVNKQIMYDLTDLTYGTTGFDPNHMDYLVVIPTDADYSGLIMTLYDIVVPYEIIGAPTLNSVSPPVPNANTVRNPIITPEVTVKLDDAGSTVILNQQGTVGSTKDSPTLVPSVHPITFVSPDPGKKKTATITVTYRDSQGVVHQRPDQYHVTFVRRGEVTEHVFAYGNTPYGMIMNENDTAVISDKTVAKKAYDVHDRFDPAYTPVKAAALKDFIYWPQAWEGEYKDWPTHWGERNLDKNDFALVAYVGEPFTDPGILSIKDSTGTPLPMQVLERSVEVAVLDYTDTTIADLLGLAPGVAVNTTADKFNGTKTEVIDLGPLTMTTNGTAPASQINALTDPQWKTTDGRNRIRPGLYALTYTYVDFDGATCTLTRPLVLLSHLGDIDAGGGLADSDADLRVDYYDGTSEYEALDSDDLRMRIIEPYNLGDSAGSRSGIPFAVTNYPDYDKSIYRYRICDVNNDRHINQIDVNRIFEKGFFGSQDMVDYYRPVDYIHNP